MRDFPMREDLLNILSQLRKGPKLAKTIALTRVSKGIIFEIR